MGLFGEVTIGYCRTHSTSLTEHDGTFDIKEERIRLFVCVNKKEISSMGPLTLHWSHKGLPHSLGRSKGYRDNLPLGRIGRRELGAAVKRLDRRD